MKIKYEFATETVEVEVTDKLGNIIVDLERQEYNVNHKETRRHCSLDAFNLDNALFPSDEDLEAEVAARDDDIVNIGLHFFLKDVRPMLPSVMNHSTAGA